MKEIGARLRSLREGAGLSQAKVAKMIRMSQVSVNRYESGNALPSAETLIWYADYFDVSMDYIFNRTDKPQGKLYTYEPESLKNRMSDKGEWEKFVRYCFEDGSPLNAKLKETLIKMAGGDGK